MNTARTGLCALLLFLYLPAFGQWVQTAFPKEYFVTDLHVTGDTVLSVLGGAVFLSEDGGASARFLGDGTGLPFSLRATLIDNTLYALSDLSGISRSVDGGASWQAGTFNPPVDLSFQRVIPNGDGRTLAIGYRNLYRSSDGGLFWEEVSIDVDQESYRSLLSGVAIGDTILLGSEGKVLRSDDDGATWSLIEVPGLENQITVLRADLAGRLYAASSGGGVYRSLNGGLNWEPFYTGVPPVHGNVLDLEIAGGTELYITTNIYPVDSLPRNLFKYVEESSQWEPVCAEENSTTVFIELASDGEYLYASTRDEGVLKRPLTQLADGECTLTSDQFTSVFRPLRMYPNPVTDRVIIDLDVSGQQVSYTVMDVLGRKVLEQDRQVREESFHIDLTGLPPGTYLVSLRTQTGSAYSGRFVRER